LLIYLAVIDLNFAKDTTTIADFHQQEHYLRTNAMWMVRY